MRSLKILFFILLAIRAIAQEDAVDAIQADPKAREKIKAAHAAYITERLGLTAEEAEKFWPVYREFAQKRQTLRQQMRDARKNNQDEKAILDLDLRIKQQQLDLEKDYSGRFRQIITPQKLVNLRQAERDFLQIVLRQIHQRQNQRDRQQIMRDRQQQRIQQRNN